jgi:hypothetical protein
VQRRVRYGVFTPSSLHGFKRPPSRENKNLISPARGAKCYAVTSYGSQGKTVDNGLFSDSTVKAATNAQQLDVVHNAFFNDAISMTKRYFTSFFTRRS